MVTKLSPGLCDINFKTRLYSTQCSPQNNLGIALNFPWKTFPIVNFQTSRQNNMDFAISRFTGHQLMS